MGIEEFQRQQRELKEAERKKKAEADAALRQHKDLHLKDVDKKNAALKRQLRDRKTSAVNWNTRAGAGGGGGGPGGKEATAQEEELLVEGMQQMDMDNMAAADDDNYEEEEDAKKKGAIVTGVSVPGVASHFQQQNNPATAENLVSKGGAVWKPGTTTAATEETAATTMEESSGTTKPEKDVAPAAVAAAAAAAAVEESSMPEEAAEPVVEKTTPQKPPSTPAAAASSMAGGTTTTPSSSSNKGTPVDYLDEFRLKQQALKEDERKKKAETAVAMRSHHDGELREVDKQQAAFKKFGKERKQSALSYQVNHRSGSSSATTDQQQQMRLSVKAEEEEPNNQEEEEEEDTTAVAKSANQEKETIVAGVSVPGVVTKLEEESAKSGEEVSPAVGGIGIGAAGGRDAEANNENQDEPAAEKMEATNDDDNDDEPKEPELQEETTTTTPPAATMDNKDTAAAAAAAAAEESTTEIKLTRVEVDFQFGLILPDTEPKPEMDKCMEAASEIVPNTFTKEMIEAKNIVYNPEHPPVVHDIFKDENFVPKEDVPDKNIIRWLVKGKVPVFLKDKVHVTTPSPRPRAPLQSTKSFRRSQKMADQSKEGGGDEVVAGSKRWKQIREGKETPWEEVLEASEEGTEVVEEKRNEE